MGPRFVIRLGICLMVTSWLLSCTPSQSIAPSIEAPVRVIAIRDAALNYITERYNLSSILPARDFWQIGAMQTDQVGMHLYVFKSGEWTLHVRVPADSKEICYIELIFARTGFEWTGTVDESMAVNEVSYVNWVMPMP